MSFTPLYEKIKERIRTDLLTAPGQEAHRRLPTERELEALYRVSRPTISKALAALAAEGLLTKEQGRGSFTRLPASGSSGAAVLRSARPLPVVSRREASKGRRNLALCITLRPGETDWNDVAITRGVQEAIDPNAFRLMIHGPHGDTLEAEIESEAQELSRLAMDTDIAGIILWYQGGETNRPVLERLRAAQVPVVFIDRKPPPGFEADFVGINDERAAREVVKHLIALGHRRIAHITNPEQASTVAGYRRGYRRALEEANIPFESERILTGPILGLNGGENAETLADRLLRMPDPPTAVFAVTDYAALALVKALTARGVRVPGDIAVAGFENIEQWSSEKPFLTTIHQPFERMGEEAVTLLLERIESGPTSVYRHVLLEAPLIVRESTSSSAQGERL